MPPKRPFTPLSSPVLGPSSQENRAGPRIRARQRAAGLRRDPRVVAPAQSTPVFQEFNGGLAVCQTGIPRGISRNVAGDNIGGGFAQVGVDRSALPFSERVTVTVPYALEATGIGRTKFYEEVKAGRIKITKVGARTLVYVSSLLELLESGRSAPSRPPKRATAASLKSRRSETPFSGDES